MLSKISHRESLNGENVFRRRLKEALAEERELSAAILNLDTPSTSDETCKQNVVRINVRIKQLTLCCKYSKNPNTLNSMSLELSLWYCLEMTSLAQLF